MTAESEGFNSLEILGVKEKNENSVTLEFSVPASSPYYDGHFPGFPILPAVAQTEMILRLAAKHFGSGIDVSEIKRIKFSNFLFSDRPHLLRLDKKDNTLSFRVFSPDGETVFSQGSFVLRDGP